MLLGEGVHIYPETSGKLKFKFKDLNRLNACFIDLQWSIDRNMNTKASAFGKHYPSYRMDNEHK